jgi:hypothetical protein
MKSQLHYLSASHCAAPVTFGSELPGVRTVCAVLSISLTKVKQLRTSTLGYVIATPTELPGVRTVCAVLPISLTKVKQLRASTLGYVIATPTEFPGVRTVCAVLPISLTKVKPLRTSTLGYVITTPLPFRVALRRAGDLRFRVAGDVYRLRRIIYAVVRCQIAIYPHGKTGVGYPAGHFCCGVCQQQQLCRSCAFPAQGCGRSPLPWVAAQLL